MKPCEEIDTEQSFPDRLLEKIKGNERVLWEIEKENDELLRKLEKGAKKP